MMIRGGAATRWRSLTGIVALVVSSVALAVSPVSAAAHHSATAKTTNYLKQGLKFYKGKTIILIAPASAGGVPDLSARLVAPFLSQFLHATVNVLDNGAGNSYPAQDQAAAAPPDGLTVGILSPVADISSILVKSPALNFNPARETFLGASVGGPTEFVGSPNSAFTSWNAVKNATAANPVSILSVVSGAGNLYIRSVVGIFGLHANVISSYSTTSVVLQGFLRGDGPVAALSTGMIDPSIETGKATPILQTLPLEPGLLTDVAPYLKNVPTIASLAKTDPPKTKAQQLALQALLDILKVSGSIYFVPPRTPKAEVVAMQAALKYALGPISHANALLAGVPPGYVNATSAKSQYDGALKYGKVLARYLQQ